MVLHKVIRSTKEMNGKVEDIISENSHWLSLSSSLAFLLKAWEKGLALALAFFKASSLPYTTNGYAFLRQFIFSLITAVEISPACAPWLQPDTHIALSLWLLCSFHLLLRRKYQREAPEGYSGKLKGD